MVSKKFIAKVCAVSLAIGMSPSAFAGGDDVLSSAPCSQALSELCQGFLIAGVRAAFLRDVAIGSLCKTYTQVAAFCSMLATYSSVDDAQKAHIECEFNRLCQENEEFRKTAEACWVRTSDGEAVHASYSPMQSSRSRLVAPRSPSRYRKRYTTSWNN